MGRKATREITMKFLYQLEIQKDGKDEQLVDIIEEHDLKETRAKIFT
jgi:N utilization substance protein B